MNESKSNIPSNFNSKDEAFEFLVQHSQNQALKDQWKKELDQLPDAPNQNEGFRRSLVIKRIVAIAASFLVLVGSLYWFNNQEESLQQIAATMITETNIVNASGSYTRGTIETEEDVFSNAIQKEINIALENEDYEASVGLFLTKEQKNQLSIVDKFYYALSIAKTDNSDYNKAIRLLDDIISQKEKYYNEALWLQALLYIKIDDLKNSKRILNKLINNTNYQITNTKALLKKMAD